MLERFKQNGLIRSLPNRTFISTGTFRAHPRYMPCAPDYAFVISPLLLFLKGYIEHEMDRYPGSSGRQTNQIYTGTPVHPPPGDPPDRNPCVCGLSVQ